VYLLDRPAQGDLGADGHPVRGTVLSPPAPGLRRMWVGGRVRLSGGLRCGERAIRRSQVTAAEEKRGRSGPLTFITVRRQVQQRGRIVVDERQDVVYRPAPGPARPSGDPSADDSAVAPGNAGRVIEVTPTLLFRFSALTYNAHRIHYDRGYACDVEGYPGLLVHGPLQALTMAEAARSAAHPDSSGSADLTFDYRLSSPLFDHQGMVVSAVRGAGATATAVRDSYGRQTASGTLRGDR
jgi:3-methylfumaryl-CoA hydratase